MIMLIGFIFTGMMNSRCEAANDLDYYGKDNEPEPPPADLSEPIIIETKRFNFVASEYPICQNQDLKTSMIFFVTKALDVTSDNTFVYFVTLNEDTDVNSRDKWLAKAFSKKGIIGKFVFQFPPITRVMDVKENSRNCGLEFALAYGIFTDRDVLANGGFFSTGSGYDPGSSYDLLAEYFRGDHTFTDYGKNKCKFVVGLTNVIKPREGGRAFIKAALEAEFEMLFTFKNRYNEYRQRECFSWEDSGEIMSLRDALKSYGTTFETAKDFLNANGNQWFFCKCKDNTGRFNGNELTFTFSGRILSRFQNNYATE